MGGVKKWLRDIYAKIRSSEAWPVSAIIWAVLAAATVMGIFGFVPLWFPKEWKWGKDEMSILERMKFAAYVVGGGLVLWQLQISNRRSTALEKTAALGEKGNITERFKNAIEHLGNPSESIRMGGIYGLYHVVRESRGYADTVLKILCAHAKSIMTEPEYAKQENPSNEIAAILDILFPINFSDEKQDDRLFSKVDISNWRLRGVDMIGRDMKYVHGVGVNLLFAQLSHADLSGANLSGANLSGANLSVANLLATHMSYADLSKASLLHTNLSQANLFSANLSKAFLSGADLSKARMPWANLSKARLSRANLSEANLSEANLSEANLSEANLSGVDLSEANLSKADLSGVNLSKADLSEANLSGAHITAEQLLQVKILYNAQLDDHICEEIMHRKPELLGFPADPPTEEE